MPIQLPIQYGVRIKHLRPGLGIAQHILDSVDDHEHDVIVNRPLEESTTIRQIVGLGFHILYGTWIIFVFPTC
jgi:hypothetical protein